MHLLIFVLLAFLSHNVYASGDVLLNKDASEIMQRLLISKEYSCILSSTYRNKMYIEIYQCGDTKDLGKTPPVFSKYEYFEFTVLWYFQTGKTIKDAKQHKTIHSIWMKRLNTKNNYAENYIIDKNSEHLWLVLKRYTCFRLDSGMTVSQRCVAQRDKLKGDRYVA